VSVVYRGVSQGREAPLGWEQRTAGMPAGSVAVVCCLSPFAGCHRGAKPPSAESKEPRTDLHTIRAVIRPCAKWSEGLERSDIRRKAKPAGSEPKTRAERTYHEHSPAGCRWCAGCVRKVGTVLALVPAYAGIFRWILNDIPCIWGEG